MTYANQKCLFKITYVMFFWPEEGANWSMLGALIGWGSLPMYV